VTLEQILDVVRLLPVEEKVRLIEEVAKDVERELQPARRSRKSLWGLCADLGMPPTEDQIRQVRKEVWANFPREMV